MPKKYLTQEQRIEVREKLALVTIGSDVEFFLQSPEGAVIPGIDYIPGTKDDPYPLINGALQLDNVMAEFNSIPAADEGEFVANLGKVFNEVREFVGRAGVRIYEKYDWHEFEAKDLVHPLAKMFGCAPEMTAYGGDVLPAPQPRKIRGLRTCGGHVHIGYSEQFPELDPLLVGQACEVTLGLMELSKLGYSRRKKIYGKPGAMRIKPYGIEYRGLGNWWARGAPDGVFRAAKQAVRIAHKVPAEDEWWGVAEKKIKGLIEDPPVAYLMNHSADALRTYLLQEISEAG